MVGCGRGIGQAAPAGNMLARPGGDRVRGCAGARVRNYGGPGKPMPPGAVSHSRMPHLRMPHPRYPTALMCRYRAVAS